ncbi:MAG: SxtJ family membrane protein [Vicinamibacterales bacterium]
MAHRVPKNPERSFGLSVGGVLLLMAGFALWRGRMTAAEWLGAVGAVLVVLGAVAPALLYYPSKVWWRFAIALGWVNARIILSVAFAIVLTPISLVWRLIGRDPLQRKRAGWKGWTPSPERYRRGDHFTKMY